MGSATVPGWNQALLVAVPASVLASLTTILVVQVGPSAAVPATQETGEVLRQLAELQRRMDERLSEIDLAAAPSQPAALAREEASPAPDPALERLTTMVERLTAVFAQQRAPTGPYLVPRDLPVNHAALADLHELARRDRNAARRSTMLLTAEELLARFGLPDELGGSGDDGVFWNYFNLGPDGVRKGGTCFVLKEGRVLWHEISIPE